MAVPVPETLTAIAALITSLGALIASLVSNNSSKRVGKELANSVDEGSLMQDRVEHIAEMQRSQGHQIGEMKEDMHVIRRDLSSLITKEILK
ncbi:hypothetical protein [Arcanobacterium haemolyticum]